MKNNNAINPIITELNSIPSIFVESNEERGLLIDSYIPIIDELEDLIERTESAAGIYRKDPERDISWINRYIDKFKDAMSNLKLVPEEIDSSRVGRLIAQVKREKDRINKLLRQYGDIKNSVKLGNNWFNAIGIKPKTYVNWQRDPERYEKVNASNRCIHRALDWIEKYILDVYNLVTQDENLLSLVDAVYHRHHLYESVEEEIFNERWIIPEFNYKINYFDWNPGNPLWITGADSVKEEKLANKLATTDDAEIITSKELVYRLTSSIQFKRIL